MMRATYQRPVSFGIRNGLTMSDAPMALQAGHGTIDLAGAQLFSDGSLLSVPLSSILHELGVAQPGGKAGEQTACIDLGKLLGVANQDHLG